MTAPAAQAIIDLLGPVLLGNTVWERDRLWRECLETGRAAGLTPTSWGSVDVALWDLFAKAQNLPLFRAIGGFRDRVPAVRRGSRGASTEARIDEAITARDSGLFGYVMRGTRESRTLAPAHPTSRRA